MTVNPDEPVTRSVRRSALARRVTAKPDAGVGPSRDRVTEVVAEALRAVLGLERVDRSARFADIGRDSLLAVRILGWCREALDVRLPLRLLTTSSTVGEFIDAVRELHDRANQPDLSADAATTVVNGPVPLTRAQQALYSLYALGPDLPVYNVNLVLRFTGGVDRARLATAMRALAARHEVLRCRFEMGPEGPVARLVDEAVPDLDEVRTADSTMADDLVRKFVEQPVDLAQGVARARLVRVDETHSVLVLVVHHIVCDGWSLRLLARDLTHLYRDGDDSALPVIKASALEAHLRADRADVAQAIEYWKDRLHDAPELLRLPLDRSRAAVRGYRGARLPIVLGARRTRQLEELGARHGTTLFTTLALALSVLLQRYTGQDDLVFTFPVARREELDTHELVAYLVTMVPLRVRLDGDPLAGDLLAGLHADIAEAYEHAALPLERIVDAVGAAHDSSYVAFGQVALALLPGRDDLAGSPGLEVERVDVGTRTTKFDMSWYFEETDDGLVGYVEYASELFDVETIDQLVRHFEDLLGSLIASDALGRRVSALPMAQGETTHSIGALADQTGWQPAHELFEQWAEKTPDAPALWHEGAHITYAELNSRANALARYLLERGVGRETLVGISVERSPEQLTAVLAVLKAGAAYLPVDPGYPAERQQYMVEDSGLRTIIARADRAAQWRAARPDLDVVDVDDAVHRQGGPNPGVAVEHGQLAYVIYTSGTTGKPKGAELTHGGLANVIRCSIEDFDLGGTSRVLQFVSFSFDASVWEIFMGLASGGVLCLAPPDLATARESIDHTIRESGATLLYLPPALLATIDPASVPDVRVVITGGDRISAELRNRWASRARFFVAYGPTEGTIVQTWQERPEESTEVPPIGLPFRNVVLHVLDRDGRPTPPGVVGEVHVGGVAVGRGYRARAALTADRFIPDPFSPVPGARMYRTGDLVRTTREGSITFVGRADQQVKIRGYRIEIGEVEGALRAIDGVDDAVVVPEPGAGGQQRLVAYLRLGGAVIADHPDRRVRERLRGILPEHMVPSVVHVVDAFPLTANGKVDRRALPGAVVAPAAGPSLEEALALAEALSDEEARAVLETLD